MKTDKVVLGLLQNLWVHNPGRVKEILARRPPAFRRKYLAALLFYRSLSGRRLKVAFGEWCDHVIWENASPAIAARSNADPIPDLSHVRRVLAEVQAQIVLAFGQRAAWALDQIAWGGVIIQGPHPAARCSDIGEQLAAMRRTLEIRCTDEA